MFSESASLVLKHSDISSNQNVVSVVNKVGYWSNGKQITGWNVNLRRLMGDEMYNKHEKFIIRLNQFCHSAVDFPASYLDNYLHFKMSGLNFCNTCYDVKTKNQSLKYHFLSSEVESSISIVRHLAPNVSIGNFKKGTEDVTIVIEMFRGATDEPAQYGVVDKLPHMAFAFDIIPIKNSSY